MGNGAGAVQIIACNATISESRFVRNTVTTPSGEGDALGGAISSQLNSSVEVVSCIFERNTGFNGGAIAAFDSHITLSGNILSEIRQPLVVLF